MLYFGMSLDLDTPAADSSTVAETAFQPADRPWDELVLVCSKCCKKVGPHMFGEDGHTHLRTDMKQEVRETPSLTRLRVTEVSCLGVCPADRVTVGAFQPDGRIHLETVAPTVSGTEVLAHLRSVGAIAPVIKP